MSVPDAGREYLNLGRNASYEAARRGDIPTIQIGKLLKVPVRAMERKLDEAGGEHSEKSESNEVNEEKSSCGTPTRQGVVE
jgi:hypothetical protein